MLTRFHEAGSLVRRRPELSGTDLYRAPAEESMDRLLPRPEKRGHGLAQGAHPEQACQAPCLSSLPILVRTKIYQHLTEADLARLSITAKFFNDDLTEPHLWQQRVHQYAWEADFETKYRLDAEQIESRLSWGFTTTGLEDTKLDCNVAAVVPCVFGSFYIPCGLVPLGIACCLGAASCLGTAALIHAGMRHSGLDRVSEIINPPQSDRRRHARQFAEAAVAAHRAEEQMRSVPEASAFQEQQWALSFRTFHRLLKVFSKTSTTQRALDANRVSALACLDDSHFAQLLQFGQFSRHQMARALLFCAQAEQPQIARRLVEAGADMDAVVAPNTLPSRAIIGASLKEATRRGEWAKAIGIVASPFYTPGSLTESTKKEISGVLSSCVRAKQFALASSLVEAGADLDAVVAPNALTARDLIDTSLRSAVATGDWSNADRLVRSPFYATCSLEGCEGEARGPGPEHAGIIRFLSTALVDSQNDQTTDWLLRVLGHHVPRAEASAALAQAVLAGRDEVATRLHEAGGRLAAAATDPLIRQAHHHLLDRAERAHEAGSWLTSRRLLALVSG